MNWPRLARREGARTTDPLATESTSGPLERRHQRAAALRLAGYSFLILFLELALIRYVPGHVRVFGFFLNFVLIAAFLGMGLGLLRSEQAEGLRWAALPAVLLLFGAVKYFANVVVEAPPDRQEFIWGIFLDIAPTVRRIGILPVTLLLFTLCALVFVPLGAALGAEFRKFRPLHAYSIDITGSLLGILAFGSVSAFGVRPLAWFALAFLMWILLALPSRRFAGGLALSAAASLALVAWTAGPRPEYWSPYYRINLFNLGAGGLALDVNGSRHQYMLRLDSTVASRFPTLAEIRNDYLRPFQLVTRLDTVLVVGAGTGNDVALLLEQGARYVDAVEIDPTILAVGRTADTLGRYADPRVHAHVDDARAFLRKADRRYDVIVFGTLDSQTLLSAMSSLRLDNYVYTVEAFQSARARLKPDGCLITYHMSQHPWIAAKIYQVLQQVFERQPLVYYYSPHRLFNLTFVVGPNVPAALQANPLQFNTSVPLPRDDWPYLYLARRSVPAHYVWALAGVLLVTAMSIAWAGRGSLQGGFDYPMFFLGAGFLLLETKSVTEMSLLFGSTWAVNLLVFSSILVVILLANLLTLRWPPRSLGIPFAWLFASLVLAYAVRVRSLLGLGDVAQWMLGSVLVALPIFFAAAVFAMLFREREASTRALACNLLGAVVGGVLEYSAMMVGIKAMYLVAGGAYLAVLVAAGVFPQSPGAAPVRG